MRLPADSHVHSEWSWDTGGPASDAAGRMRLVCARAVAIGLPAVVFTEHLDFDGWRIDAEDAMPNHRELITPDGILEPPELDVPGYLDSIDRCRHEFPGLRILTGVEFGQPHLFDAQAAQLLDLTQLDRVNGSLHTLQNGQDRSEPMTLFRVWPVDRVLEEYLAEIPRMVADSDSFAVFTHLDYAVRSWPTEQAGPFDPRRFEEGFRHAMRSLAERGRALEMNTRRLWPWMPRWWSEEGGRAITFGSDAHVPAALATGFGEAMDMVEQYGFRPGRRPEDFWTR
ncbi:PHP domain-containing protein [uncultured Friedmanniella sp.]|uniref:PHP domain-containing protein n=1 Tax=uncultured Friedmanniella sp. TaxID=335381 RepID=UPI0035C9C4C2